MDNKITNEILTGAVASYIRLLESTVKELKQTNIDESKEYNDMLEKAYKENEQLTERIKQKNDTIFKMQVIIEEAHKSQDADVIVGAITGNVPRETWENVIRSFRNNTLAPVADELKINIQNELAELIERSLEYKWGR